MKAHHMEIVKKALRGEDAFVFRSKILQIRQFFVDRHGCSSPYLPWEYVNVETQEESAPEKVNTDPLIAEDLLTQLESTDVLAIHDIITGLTSGWQSHSASSGNAGNDKRDPSAYLPLATSWEIILRADQCMRQVHLRCQGHIYPSFAALMDKIVATAISSLSEVGTPSWGANVHEMESFWSERFPAACNDIMNVQSRLRIEHEVRLEWDRWVPIYARLSILRAAYYTIMMRAAGEVGPGLAEDSRIDTALVYMA